MPSTFSTHLTKNENMKGVITVLRLAGFTKARWDKCPVGFKESGYPCYKRKDGSWCELYLTDVSPYGQIWITGMKGKNWFNSTFFENKTELKKLLNPSNQTKN